jgi:uncharacterized membrane protein YdjX (TVP38/TMEM64 family)
VGVLAALILGGTLLRNAFGIEWSAASIRELVRGFGIWGPLVFVALLAFRFALVIPSVLLLSAAGLLFGALAGSLYGALGLTVAGLVKYVVVQWAGAETMRAQVPGPYRPLLELARSKAGAGFVVLASGYPVGPIGVVHLGAAIAGMALATFALAVAAGSLVRAAIFSFFGSALGEGENLLLASVLLVGAAALPLAHPRVRQWLRANYLRRDEGS